MRRAQYDAVVRDLLGVTTVPVLGNVQPSSQLVDDSDGSLTDIAWNQYKIVADAIASQVMASANRTLFMACEPAAPGCLKSTIESFGRKAFRRPLRAEEVTSFERFANVTPPGTPEEVAEAVLYAFLISPSFLMLPELSQELEGTTLKLSSHEVAARLSFLLWNSVPDDALNTAADTGQLATKEQIFAQAQRMIQVRDKASPVLTAFHRVYADIRDGSHWGTVAHDSTLFPNYTPNIVSPMMAEIDAFFEEVAFQGGSFKDLFLSNVGFVNRDTAPIYGLDPTPYGTELTRVELNATERPGFLTRVGFLSSFSAEKATSPILRGAFVATKVLGVELGDPPPEAAEATVPPGMYKTNRAVVEALTAPAKCAGCHAVAINPPGFVLERYDSIGGLQTLDPLGDPIDATAEVIFSDTNIKPIASPVELMNELGTGPDAKRNYAAQWVTFATRRVANPNDACQVEALSLKLSQEGYTILDLVTDLTQADSFRLRTVGN